MTELRDLPRRIRRGVGRRLAPLRATLELERDILSTRFGGAHLAIFHEFVSPPWGGGNQFLLALRRSFEEFGLEVEENRISAATPACLFNSFNFDFQRLRRFQRDDCRMVHRVDGPVTVYRGYDDGTDERIWKINQELAHATVFQSEYSRRKHEELGYWLASPRVIRNTVDPTIFNARGRQRFDSDRKVRLITTSWSNHPKKGGPVYRWLEDALDWERYEYTFVGRSDRPLKRARMIEPVGSEMVARLLRQHDIFLTATLDDACSNALIEALACGLPAIYARSGGSPEIVGNAGLGFESREEIPGLLDTLVSNYQEFQRRISVPSLVDVALDYVDMLSETP